MRLPLWDAYKFGSSGKDTPSGQLGHLMLEINNA